MLRLPPISSNEIAAHFGYEYKGEPGAYITHVATPSDQSEDALLWARDAVNLKKIGKGTVVIPAEIAGEANQGVNLILTGENVRLCFARILNRYFDVLVDELSNHVDEFRKDASIRIGDNVFIGQNVTIGEGSLIFPNVVIHANTIIGKHCVIQSGTTVGTTGLGFERLEDGSLYRFPQLGGVIIEDHVEIGPNTTIRKAALGNTIIRRGVVVGGLCNIGHNSVTGENSLLITQCVIGGSAVIGKNCFIGINALVKNRVKIGDNVQVGMGAVVLKDISSDAVVFGNPAEEVTDYKNWTTVKKKLMKEHYGL